MGFWRVLFSHQPSALTVLLRCGMRIIIVPPSIEISHVNILAVDCLENGVNEGQDQQVAIFEGRRRDNPVVVVVRHAVEETKELPHNESGNGS
jgi:hypothetical protein